MFRILFFILTTLPVLSLPILSILSYTILSLLSSIALSLSLLLLPPSVHAAETHEEYNKIIKERTQTKIPLPPIEEKEAPTELKQLPPPPPPPGSPEEEFNVLTSQLPIVVEEPKRKAPTLREQAFKQLLDKISPLTPEQIIQLRKEQDNTQRAVATFPTTPPRPVSSTLTVDLSPGVTPPIIRLASGFVTSIVFLDITGQSWPIADYSLGNPKNFNITWDKKTNTLFVQSTIAYSTGNLAVRLANLDTPVMLSLVSGQKEVDYRIDLQVNGAGPNALPPIVGDGLPAAPNQALLSVLDGIPPPGSTELEVCGSYGRAWVVDGKLIFRTKLTMLSPAWIAMVSSADGTHVYELKPTPLILASREGRPVKIELKGL